jgi:protein-S-isoprenylcysteine O-methyltransferase Ste14
MHIREDSAPAIELATVQLLRKRLVMGAVVFLFVSLLFIGSKFEDGHHLHEGIEFVGIALIGICILGRTWTSYYIAGKKDVALVTFGPYSMCRNPLYFFSVIGAIGVGAQFGSIVYALILGISTWMLFSMVAQQEEKALEVAYGQAYRDYCARVRRFLPRPSQWHGATLNDVRFDRVTRTFIDACVFLLAIPIAEGVEYLQETGVLPVLLRVP